MAAEMEAKKGATCRVCDPAASLRVQIASDLHLEFYDVLPPFEHLLRPAAPILALLGDICALGHRRGAAMYEAFLQQCCSHFDHVLVLLGNHEFYSDEVSKVTCDEIISFVRSLSAKYPKVLLLENEGVTLSGVRVVGTALWSAVPDDAVHTVEFSMNDYRLMYVSDSEQRMYSGSSQEEAPLPPHPGRLPIISRLTAMTSKRQTQSATKRLARVQDTNAWHCAAVKFLEREAMETTAKGMNLLVLTHHTPSFRGTSNPRYGCEPGGISSAFSTNLEYMLSDPRMTAIHTWCFGHTHYNSNQQISGRRLVSNQRGYVEKLSFGYREDFVVEVPTQRVNSGEVADSTRIDSAVSAGFRGEKFRREV